MLGKKLDCLIAIVLLALALAVAGQPALAQDDPSAPIKNLSFQNADIRTVIGFLADYGQVNIVTTPEVQGNVTFSLKRVTWREALDILCKTYGLTVDETAKFIRVVPTKTYLDEVATLEKHNAEKEKLTELNTSVMKIDNAAAEDLQKTVTPLLSERGKVQIDKRTNNLIVRDVPSNVTKISKLVSDLDYATKQIRISTQMVEVSTSKLQEYGIDITSTGFKRTSSGKEYTQESSQLLDRVANPAGNFTFSTIQDGWDLKATISALVSDGHGKIVAHPEITTVDNKEAKIQMGQKIPIKQFDQAGNVVITFEEIGTLLRVTPHITEENKILMALRPERSSYQFDANGVIINTSNAETNVVVENGQTAVIGGLTTQDVINDVSGIPVLKDIPLLGALFRYERKKVENRDLVIFVTPTVVEGSLAGTPPDSDRGN
ncbi:MAG: type IV pilus secretin PilQ [candidate division Zixibacteria bacterium]|nr:type IV pilus secretin PilQ [candidate division Zixibacteria bacterium]